MKCRYKCLITFAVVLFLCLNQNLAATADHRISTQNIEKSCSGVADRSFTLVWFTDPQYYASSFPHIYDFLGDWLVSEYKKGSYGYAINTGDLVNNASDKSQWNIADRNFKKLDDSNVPYGVLAGNHDVSIHGLNYSKFMKYFGTGRYKNKPWYGGSSDNNRNHYDLITLGRHDFIILYLGYDTRLPNKTAAWSNRVLEAYPGRTAIVAMHDYLTVDSELTEMAEAVLENIIKKNDNVKLVLCGHYHGVSRNIRTVRNKDGSSRKVLEILCDYQNAPKGGNGFLRLLTFHPSSNTLCVTTYSPYIHQYNFFDKRADTFTEKMELIS